MRTLFLLLLSLLTATASCLYVLPQLLPTAGPAPVFVSSQGPTVERLEKLSKLVVTRVCVSDVLTGAGHGCKGAWLIRGDALLAVNLSQAVITEKDASAKRAMIQLPQPEVMQERVDHSRSRTWEVKTTTWIPWIAEPDALRDTVMQEAQRLVSQAAGSPENLQQAKAAAEAVIANFFSEMGWSVTVTWASPPSEGQKTIPSSP